MPSIRSNAGIAVSLSLLLAGCMSGPDFVPPATPPDNNYEATALPTATQQAAIHGGDAQHFRLGDDLPGEWWTLFHSPALDSLIKQALAANPDLKAADAALRQARELAVANRAGLLPAVDASASESRQQTSGASSGIPIFSSIYNLTTGAVAVSYNPDVFGGTHRAIEAGEASADFQRWQREAAVLTLTANIVTTALQEAALRAEILATKQIIDAEAEQLTVVKRQFTLGGAAKTDILAQESLLAQSRATLPPLENQLQQQRHLLAALAGRSPNQGVVAEFELASLSLPAELPVTIPAKLVQQRPDIRAATANLHFANAEIGVAIANQWPQLTLSANYGTAADQIGSLFTPAGQLWSIGAGVTQPIFHGGALAHRRAAAEAAFEQAQAQYQSTVLTALRNVADSLRALQSDAETLHQQLDYAQSAAASLTLAKQRFAVGAISHLSLLDAERTEAQARIALIQAQAARFADTAALFQALGGGWWNRPDTTLPAPDLLTPLF